MKFRDIRRAVLLATVALGVTFGGKPADAAFIFTFEQVGANVVGIGNGSLNTTALTRVLGATPILGILRPEISVLRTAGTVVVYGGLAGPVSFGPGGETAASVSSGDAFLLQGIGGFVGTAFDYVSGAPLANSLTFNGQTLASLGLTPGTYVWSWGSGATADSFTLDITPPAVSVPEPATLALFGAGLLGLAATRRRKA